MLSVQNVTKKYGKTIANNNISFHVDEGQIAILLGPNGAGKSTIIKCITGLLRYSGAISIGGNANSTLEAKRLLGYVPEMPAVYDLLTVSEHVEFISRAYRQRDEKFARQLLERFELWDKKDKLGKELSKGMQQKLSLCCALVHRPKLVILDEPMVGLDPFAIKELKHMFAEHKKQGTALLISTHMIDSVENSWDIAHIMVDGAIAATRNNTGGEGDTKSLEELFFDVTGRRNPQ